MFDWSKNTQILEEPRDKFSPHVRRYNEYRELKNHKLIKLLPRINRLTSKLNSYQSVEHAGFGKGFGTTDHLHKIKILIEKTSEYNIPLHLAFVDYHKAFYSIET